MWKADADQVVEFVRATICWQLQFGFRFHVCLFVRSCVMAAIHQATGRLEVGVQVPIEHQFSWALAIGRGAGSVEVEKQFLHALNKVLRHSKCLCTIFYVSVKDLNFPILLQVVHSGGLVKDVLGLQEISESGRCELRTVVQNNGLPKCAKTSVSQRIMRLEVKLSDRRISG